MQSSKNSCVLQLRKALVFLFILTISSCSGCGKGKGSGQGRVTSKRVFIMLVHGIDDQRDGVSNLTPVIDPLKKALEGDQGNNKKRTIDIFAPARQNSVTAPIKEQAEDMFKVIQDKGIKQDDKLIIVAHSQGGPLAMALYAMFMRDWKNLAIVSIQGALCGSHAAQPNQSEFKQLTEDIQQLVKTVKGLIQSNKILKLNELFLNYGGAMGGAEKMKQQIIDGFPNDQAIQNQIRYALGWQNGQGGQDLVPDSLFMQELKSQMPNPVTIPMLLVAGEIKDFVRGISNVVFDDTKQRILEELKDQLKEHPMGKLIIQAAPVHLDSIIAEIVQNPVVKPDIQGKIQTRWNELISNGKSNDLVVPVSSQLGEGFIQGNMVKKKTYEDYMHLDKILSTPMFDDEVKFIKDFINN